MAAFINIRTIKINNIYVDGVKIHKNVYLKFYNTAPDGKLRYTIEIKD